MRRIPLAQLFQNQLLKTAAVNYRGQVTFGKDSAGSISHIECDTIIMDEKSKSDTIPFNEIHNSQVSLEHEAKVSKFLKNNYII